MKRVLIFIFIFWLLVFLSTFSWAQSNTFYVNTSVVSSPVGNIDIYSYYETYLSYNNIPISDIKNCVVSYDTIEDDTVIFLSDGYFYYSGGSIYCTNYIFTLMFDGTSLLGGSEAPYITYNDTYNIVGNAIYTDNTLTSFYTSTNVDGDNTSFFENAFNYDSEGENGEGGEGGEVGEGGEDENNFISSLADMLIHIIVPTSEQWEDLQDSFQDNIMDKFSLITFTFDDDLTYDTPLIGSLENSTPTLSFGSYGNINFDYLVNFINTPISFGFLSYAYGGSTLQYNLPTDGVTMRDVINFFFIIDVFLLNLYLYNKFLSKEGV